MYIGMDNTAILKKIVQKENEKIMKQSVAERNRIGEIVHDYVVKNKLLVYGGVALNNILPKDDKIYKKDEFPDYDCLSSNAKLHAKALAKVLVKEFPYTEVRAAMHEGTFKIFVNFEAVADITTVRKRFYDAMHELAIKERQLLKHKYTDKKLCIAPIFLLKHNLTKELARPKGSMYRWNKVYERQKKLDSIAVFPIENAGSSSGSGFLNNIISLIRKRNEKVDVSDFAIMRHATLYEQDLGNTFLNVLAYIKEQRLPLVGNFALGVYLGKNASNAIDCCKIDHFFSVFEVLATDMNSVVSDVKALVASSAGSNYEVLVSSRFFFKDILPKRVRISIKDRQTKRITKFMTVIDASDECYSYVSKGGYIVGSPYTLLQLFYAYWLVYYTYEEEKVHKLVEIMIAALEFYIHFVASMREKFSVECYGLGKSYTEVLKDRWKVDDTHDFVYRPRCRA